jgi:CelD/BcsL family acetyltransferase involved in cellulose biosynthesis
VKLGHDPTYDSFSPGKVLTYEMLRRAFSDGLASYEFLGGEEPWKLLWTGERRQRVLFQAFDRSPAGFAAWALFRYGRPLARSASRRWPLALLRR